MRLSLALVLLLGASCAPLASRPAAPPPTLPAAASFQVAIFGDMPYRPAGHPEHEAEQAAYRSLLETINAQEVAFVVHIGDFTGANCSDSIFAQRLEEFQSLAHPLIYTPGDNEWTDCARDGHDPLERLARLRQMFASGSTSLGRRPLPLRRQSEDPRFSDFPENARWSMGGVLFLTLHVVGTNNNWGEDLAPSAEYVARNAANLAWLHEAFTLAEQEGVRGIAIFMQANPHLEGWTARLEPQVPDGFADLRRELQSLATAFGRPVALVHGDTHYFRVDKPFVDPQSGTTLTNLTRAETFGTPNIHALLMTIHPSGPNLFRFEPILR